MTESPLLLLVDDDADFLHVLQRAMNKRGFETVIAHSLDSVSTVLSQLMIQRNKTPALAVVDLKLADESGLELIPQLKSNNEEMVIVMLTGYASIATAVTAIKLGASNYLTKPVDANEIVIALLSEETGVSSLAPNSPMSINRMEWEHIQKVLKENNGNVSATARSLDMHRRTLQRKLAKKPKSH